MRADIIIGLGFGDEGKGLITDYVCSKYDPKDTLVIRFSGGQQAGHTVVRAGKRHVSSNYGAGALLEIPTYISHHCSFYLNTIHKERAVLRTKVIAEPKLIINPMAMVTTPFDVAYNKVREKKVEHGSCGLGIGATAHRHHTTPFKLHAVDLMHHRVFSLKMHQISNYYDSLLAGLPNDEYVAYAKREMNAFVENVHRWRELISLAGYSFLWGFENLVFEGSQGVLLDKDHGIFPNVTYANTTCKNAREIIKTVGARDYHVWHVTRCYQTRHGNGWMSNEERIELVNNTEETNTHNPWQGKFRTCELDYELLNYAIDADRSYFDGPVNKKTNLVVTCMDQRPGFDFDIDKLMYRPSGLYYSYGPTAMSVAKKEFIEM